MIRQRYPTRRPVRRLLSNRWIVTLLGFVVVFAFMAAAEAGCETVGAGIDLRVGAF